MRKLRVDKDKKKIIVKQSVVKNNENKKQSYVAVGTTNITLVDKGVKKN